MCNHTWMTFGADANGNYRVCSKCGKKVYTITNADRIRAMSDEELCFLFVNTERFANLMDVSYAEMMDWLRKPATGGE